MKAFNTTDTQEIVKQILTKGELQVGEKEREAKLGNLWKEVAGMVAERVVDPSTKRPYSVSLIEKAMSEIHFNVKADKPAKSQVSLMFRTALQRSCERGSDRTLRFFHISGSGMHQGAHAVVTTPGAKGRDESANHDATEGRETSRRTSPRAERRRRNRGGRDER